MFLYVFYRLVIYAFILLYILYIFLNSRAYGNYKIKSKNSYNIQAFLINIFKKFLKKLGESGESGSKPK